MFIGEVWAPGLDPNVTYGPAASPAELQAANVQATGPALPAAWLGLAVAAVLLATILSAPRKR